MEVYAVRYSSCGNGDDDKGQVLGVFSTKDLAVLYIEKIVAANVYGDVYIEIEGPFFVDKEPVND